MLNLGDPIRVIQAFYQRVYNNLVTTASDPGTVDQFVTSVPSDAVQLNGAKAIDFRIVGSGDDNGTIGFDVVLGIGHGVENHLETYDEKSNSYPGAPAFSEEVVLTGIATLGTLTMPTSSVFGALRVADAFTTWTPVASQQTWLNSRFSGADFVHHSPGNNLIATGGIKDAGDAMYVRIIPWLAANATGAQVLIAKGT